MKSKSNESYTFLCISIFLYLFTIGKVRHFGFAAKCATEVEIANPFSLVY